MRVVPQHMRTETVVGRGTTIASIALTVIVLAAFSLGQRPPILAAQTLQPERDQVQRALDEQKKVLEATRGRAKAAQSDVAALAADRDKLNAQMIDTAKQVQRFEGELTAIEGRIAGLETQETAARADLEGRHDQIAQLLGALQRMGRNPPPVMITKRADALEMVRSAMLIARAFPELRAQADDLSGRLTELIRVTAESRAESERLRAETLRLNDARIQMAALMDDKKKSMADRQKEFEDFRRAAQDITQSVSDLNVLITRLDQVMTERVEAPKGVRTLEYKTPEPAPGGALGPDTAAGSPTSPSSTPLAGPGAAAPLSQLPPPQAQPALPAPKVASNNTTIAPRADAVLQPTASRDNTPQKLLQPRIPFDQARGRLPLPVQGRRILAYGDRNNFGRRVEGQLFEARFGAQVTSPAEGWIVYAGPFRNYGQLLIISVGSGYYIVLANMSQIDVQPGQWVAASEPIGTMAPVPKSGAKDSQPALYVDFRKDGKTIDPQPWWAAAK